jgi:CRISPR-associated protein Csm1
VQVFLKGKLQGVDAFLQQSSGGWDSFAGRCLFVTLIGETIPRALLQRLGLAPTLLGASGGGQFLVLLTEESLPAANDFLVAATRRLQEVSRGQLRLAWASTEELGAWEDVHRRLNQGMAKWRGLSAIEPMGLFDPFSPEDAEPFDRGMAELFRRLPEAAASVWSPESAALLAPGGEALPLATHCAPSETAEGPASPSELAARGAGHRTWGVLRGDVDRFVSRLSQAQSIHDYLQLSVFFRQFFAGEVQVLCTQGEFWQKISVLYTGGDDFAVYGSWDALIPFAREMQRLFHRSADEFLREFPGPEGKSISMAIALAHDPEQPLDAVYREAGRLLEIAKAEGRDHVYLFGRPVDWKELTEASELKQTMTRLVEDFGCTPQFLGELGAFYRETDRVLPGRGTRTRSEARQRPWRFYRRLNRVLEAQARHREFQKVRNSLFTEFLGKNQSQLRLKPAGRVALEWARLAQETEQV